MSWETLIRPKHKNVIEEKQWQRGVYTIYKLTFANNRVRYEVVHHTTNRNGNPKDVLIVAFHFTDQCTKEADVFLDSDEYTLKKIIKNGIPKLGAKGMMFGKEYIELNENL